MQEILSTGPLLDEAGNLVQAGYSTFLAKEYSRSAIKAGKLRIKEWDYYYIGNEKYGIALTIADNSYMSMGSVSFLDFVNKTYITKSKIGLFSKGKLNLPSTSETGDVSLHTKGLDISFTHEQNKRHIVASFNKFNEKEEDFRCDIFLEKTNEDSMVIATPFNKKKHFYYNQKINLLKANGYFKIGDELFTFGEDAFGVLDWGRGVWTYRNTWYWASLNSFNKGDYIGFNLGYGFGDTSKASENMLFYEGRSFKLEDVRFDIPMDNKGKEDYLKPWNIRSKNKDIVLTFTPILDRQDNTNLLLLKSIQNQVFGRFDGYILTEGRKIDINNLLGFAEKVTNWW